jgi:hypothetical protein
MSGAGPNAYPQTALPFTGNERIALDTSLPGGASPQSTSVSLAQLALLGLGPVKVVTDGSVDTVDVTLGSEFSLILTGTGRTLTMINPSAGQEVVGYISQDGTGSRTITTYTNVLWAAGTPPTLSIGANALDVLRFTWNATLGKWVGETVGKALA